MNISFEPLACVAWLQQILEENGWQDYERLEHTGRHDAVRLFELKDQPLTEEFLMRPVVEGPAYCDVHLQRHGFYLNGEPQYIFLGACDDMEVLVWRIGGGSNDQVGYWINPRTTNEPRTLREPSHQR